MKLIHLVVSGGIIQLNYLRHVGPAVAEGFAIESKMGLGFASAKGQDGGLAGDGLGLGKRWLFSQQEADE